MLLFDKYPNTALLVNKYSLNPAISFDSLRHFEEHDSKALVRVIAKLPKLEHSDYSLHLYDNFEDENTNRKVPPKWTFHHLKTLGLKTYVKTGW